MTLVLYITLFIATISFFIRKEYVPFLVCYMGLMTKLFMLDSSDVVAIKGEDLCIIANFLLLPVVYKENKDIFSWKNDTITKWIYLYMVFYVAEFIVTTALRWETPLNGLKVIRVSFLMWAYFIFRTIPSKRFEEFIDIALKITLFQTFLYFLQFVGIDILAGGTLNTERTEEAGLNFAWNIPTFTIFFFYFILKSEFQRNVKVVLTLLFLSMIFLTFVRGIIISVIFGLGYFIYKQSDRSKIIPVMGGGLLVVLISMSIMDRKTDSSTEDPVTEQFSEIMNDPESLVLNNGTNGTLTFRMAMLMERVYYLIENPQYLLTGVGTMHEDSPQTASQFDFVIGTINEEREYGRCIIESGDITWVPIVLRYGLIGVALHFMLFVVIIRETHNRNDFLFALAPFYIGAIIRSFDGSFFEDPVQLSLLTLFFAMVSCAKQNVME